MNNVGNNMHTVCTVLCMTTVCHGVVACVLAPHQMMIHVTHKNIHNPGMICSDATRHKLCGIEQHCCGIEKHPAALSMPLLRSGGLVCGTPTLSATRQPGTYHHQSGS